jgi:hypothetical protein
VSSVVVGELGTREEVLPVALLVVAEDTEILAEYLVDTLGLAIGLGVESGGHVGLDGEEGEEMAPEVGSEYLVAVRHNVGWQAVETIYVLEEEAGNVGCIGCGLGGDEVGHFGETVNNNEDGIVPGWR